MEVQRMAYYKSAMPRQTSLSFKNQLLLAIGRHAVVHLPSTGACHGDFTPFGVRPGARPASELRDGQEVEIIAWRPPAPQGLSYQVRRLSDRHEWWAKAICLRKSASASVIAED
jgi:hypothetical protein